MPCFICVTCGSQFAEAPAPPTACPVCEDERQYVGAGGQQWTTLDQLACDHRNECRPLEPDLYGIGTTPSFAIGQRALLVRAPGGNVLWDCVSLLDEETEEAVRELGGIAAVAISHPHYYSSMVEWGRTFGAPVYLHAADRQWVMRPDPVLRFWEGEQQQLGELLTLIRCGGHFAGGTVLHWAAGAGSRGALLSGDILQVCADRKFVSFMYSYPNYIPLPAWTVCRVARAVEPFAFDRIYGAWWDRVVPSGAKDVIARSVSRYLKAIHNPPRYHSGEEIHAGDLVSVAGSPGQVVFVLGRELPAEHASEAVYFQQQYHRGFMLQVQSMGHVFMEESDEDLEFLGRK